MNDEGRKASASESTPAPTRPLTGLMLSALGIVFGDIGTSPIYALRQGVNEAGSVDASIVMGKYVCYVMRADNEGEGGIVALTALARSGYEQRGRRVPHLLLMQRWRERLFGSMSSHSASSTKYFGRRREDVVELGVQVAL